MNETRTLAEFVAKIGYRDLTPEVIVKAKQLILDQLGCELAFATQPWSQAVYRYITERQGGPQTSTVVYYGLRTSMEDAAFANAAFGHGFEMDDDESHTTSHPGVAVIPAALATGEAQGISGKDFLVAVITGYDIMLRVGMAARTMVNRSFHSTSVAGTFGATAAAAKILGLSQDLILNALAIDASEAGGTTEYTISGGSVKRLHAGFGAQNGVKAVLLARAGITGPSTAIEGKRGAIQAFANEYYLDELTKGLGKEFRIFWTGHKPYCCCQAQHTTFDALSAILAEHPMRAEDIEEIVVEQMLRDVRAVGNVIQPEDTISAQFSGRFGVALRLIKGSNGFQDYNEKNFRDPVLLEFARKVKYVVDEEMAKLPPGAAPTRMTIKLKNGLSFSKRFDYAKGTPQNPMTPEEIESKFRGLASTVLPEKQMEEIIRTVQDLENVSDIRSLVKLLAVRKG